MIRTAPIQFTNNPDAWVSLLTALGGTLVTDSPGWKVVRFGGGVVALHGADSKERSGDLEFWFDATDPEAAARATGGEVQHRELEGAGTVWEALMADGQRLGFNPWSADSDGPAGQLSVMPIWSTPDVDAAATALKGIGAEPRIASDSGVWADFTVDDGLIAVHSGTGCASTLSFESAGPLDALAEQLEAKGMAVRVIDENFGRTLRVDHPDGREEIWINAQQDDLYGYHER